MRVSGARRGVHAYGGTSACGEDRIDPMTTPDPLIADLHAAILKVACRIAEQPDWVRDVSPTDRALVERVLELAVLVIGGRPDVVH